ncbi:MAG: hypothetical protein ACXVRZ_16730 [Gaiellaceae bacterium]
MRLLTRHPRVLLLGAVAVVAASCGGGKSSHGVAGVQTTAAASARVQITRNWAAFFSGSTPASEKVKLLQNGLRFAPLIEAEAKLPLAKETRANVTKVSLLGSSRARVTYSISLAGKPALTHQRGIAVRIGGVWKVGEQSFCSLLTLQGKPPALCGT